MSKIEKAVDYVNQHFTTALTAEAVAEACDCSVFYLPKLFRNNLGMSYQQYVMFKRVERAKNLLVNKRHYKVSTIAIESGFLDDTYFCRVFKKQTGMTPMEYRTRHINIQKLQPAY
ncbi:helix-turn-helix transcriptional regulator [Vibrio superstes]|uniref:HTH araC/xylS-type domain-containing protein n=1 Tax=Vibrio superstes NBRC 103154 TaxID=1219062 RepID=A0A511QTS4_9VIBR|nr:AraC family transcriptional regulator [Vibrio superstes]GEM80765.1 hypothetical protein VSU01S_30100 [Vibrio superstes NBRC 103154]